MLSSSPATSPLSTRDLGRLLRAFRDRVDAKPKKIADRFVKLLAQEGAKKKDASWGTIHAWLRAEGVDPEGADDVQENFLIPLERGKLEWPQRASSRDDQLELARRFADAYSVPRLMVDSLLSRQVTSPFLRQGFQDGYKLKGSSEENDYGKHTVYTVPQEKLDGTDPVFVLLELKKENSEPGYSRTHEHPGDELMLVLEGAIEVRLKNRTPEILQAGDYIHFYAEQSHAAFLAPGANQARVFIIRFYQLEGGGSRRRFQVNLKKLVDELSKKKWSLAKIRRSFEEVEARLRELTHEPSQTEANQENVLDWAGLGRQFRAFLKMLKLTYDEMLLRAAERQIELNRTRLSQLVQGKVLRQKMKWVYSLVELLGDHIPPILFAGFAYPPASEFVIVRKNKEDLVTVSADVNAPPNAEYQVPRRVLAGSDIAITFLQLIPKSRASLTDARERSSQTTDSNDAPSLVEGASPWNRHPGFELIYPLQGRVQVEYAAEGEGPNQYHIVDSALGQYAHYRSDRKHRVVVVGDQPAELFVVRFMNPTETLVSQRWQPKVRGKRRGRRRKRL
jgi:quercetin dioxygenase-like cupin family protein